MKSEVCSLISEFYSVPLQTFSCSKNLKLPTKKQPIFFPKMKRKQCYNDGFVSIKEALEAPIDEKLSIIAVILDYTLPEKSRGTDWFCTVKLIDESYQADDDGFTINVFANTPERLPTVNSAGDIIMFSFVKMGGKCDTQDYDATYDKRVSKYAIFEGKFGEDFVAYFDSETLAPANYHNIASTHDIIVSLRNWLLNCPLDSGTRESCLLLRDITEGKCFDFVCKVLKVFEVSKEEFMLFSWDGTDAPPLRCRSNLNDELENPLPLQLEPSLLSRDVLCEFPSVGTVLRVMVDQASVEHASRLPGRWVKLIDIVCKERAGFWYSVLSPSTKVRILSHEDNVVASRTSIHEKRLLTKWGRMPLSATPLLSRITETDHGRVPFATLMDILTWPEVKANFRCVVRVVAMCPWHAENFRSPRGDYRIRLTLEDPTARIHAIVYGKDGEVFFGSCPSMDILTLKRNRLLGIGGSSGIQDLDAPRNPPWVQVCIQSYCLDENNPWSSRKYRIYDTKLVA